MVLKMQAAFKHWRCLPGRKRWVPADLTGWPPGRALSRQSALAQYPVQNANQSWLPRRRTLTSTLPPHFISSWQCLLSVLPHHLNLCSGEARVSPFAGAGLCRFVSWAGCLPSAQEGGPVSLSASDKLPVIKSQHSGALSVLSHDQLVEHNRGSSAGGVFFMYGYPTRVYVNV